jgi:hypothetical protein
MKEEVYSVLLNEEFRKKFLDEAISKFGSQTSLAKYLNSKIKRRKIIRENIKGWLKGKHINGWDILIPLDVLKELCSINAQNLKKVLEYATKFNPPWKDPKNKKYLILKKRPLVVEKNYKNYLSLFSILPKQTLPSTRSGKRLPLFTKISNTEIELWSEANWKRSYIKIKEFVELNDVFFIGSAIYSSEGTTKIGKYNDSISIGNSEPAIINLFFKWLDSFLQDYKCGVKIEFNGESCNEAKLINFWKEQVPSIKNHEISIRKRPQAGSGLINNRGVLNIKISNTVLKSFISALITNSKKITLSNKSYSLHYLSGLIASEGSVSKDKLKEVTIGCTNIKERRFIRKLLKRLGLNFTEGKNQLSITGWNNFYFLYKNDIFNIPQINSISKRERFNGGFKEHQTTRGIIKLKKFKEKKFTARNWQKEFNLKRYISAHKFLKKFVEKKILLTEFKKNIKVYWINPQKIDFLESVWSTGNS